ncbi:hypothetical protein GCM10025859_06380 [Alicyclobacillus fastidiosus]|nr:hypothetical protein GCM10025859_06380 [Alicyclobacillus fastidiosus]
MSMRLRVPALILSMSALLAGCSTDTQHTSNSLSANATLAPGGDSNVVTVNPSIHGGTWQGWGTSLAWFAYVIGGAPNGVRNHIADLLFSQQKGLGLNVLRYNIGGGENPNLHFLQPRAKIPGYEPTEGNYNWTADASQRWMLQAAKKRGANVFEAFSNSPPYWMTKSDSVTGAKGEGIILDLKITKRLHRTWPKCLSTSGTIGELILRLWSHSTNQFRIGGTMVGPKKVIILTMLVKPPLFPFYIKH